MTTRTTPEAAISGLHHVTAIASDPRSNLEFYTEVLGQRLVKKTVNFDDPSTYHLYYGDASGSPGSIMTFFPWPGARRGAGGVGQATVTSYAIPPGAIGYWVDRLRRQHVPVEEPGERFGEGSLVLADPDGLRLELIETEGVDSHPAWSGEDSSPIEERAAIRGFRGVSLSEREGSGAEPFLTDVMGFTRVARAGNTTRYRIGNDSRRSPGTTLDVVTTPDYGRPGAGTVHHIAFRVESDQAELAWQRHLEAHGRQVSPVMDRQYFHSIYFREPGGVLFEIATDPPGFTLDEPVESLGRDLKLPPDLEPHRKRIEAKLPDLGGEREREAS